MPTIGDNEGKMENSRKNNENKLLIGAIEKIFRYELNFKYEKAAALYYYLLIDKGMTVPFCDFLPSTTTENQISLPRLQTGRKELLKNGVIAEIFLGRTASLRVRDRFKGEAFLPVSPNVFYYLYKDSIENHLAMDAILEIQNGFMKLSEKYNETFGLDKLRELAYRRDGRSKQKNNSSETDQVTLNMGSSNLTLCYSMYWVLYNIFNNIKSNSNISLMVSGIRIFGEHEYIYNKILEKEPQVNCILLLKKENNKYAKSMKNKHAKINFGYVPTQSNATCRKVLVDDTFALDGRKILSQSDQEPSYVGSIYFDMQSINKIKDSFNDTWNACEKIQ